MIRLRTQILSPDARIAMVACNYGDILQATVGIDDEWGIAYFSRVLGPTLRQFEKANANYEHDKSDSKMLKIKNQAGPKITKKDVSIFSLDELLGETEDLLRQLDAGVFDSNIEQNSSDQTGSTLPKPLSMFSSIPRSSPESSQSTTSQSSIIILLQVVFSSVGHVQRASSKFVALQMSKFWCDLCLFFLSCIQYALTVI